VGEYAAGASEAFIKTLAEKMPTGRLDQPEDVVEAYLYLLKDEKATASVVHTNGGGLLV
jgi:NAD(P)-dependent dehydrogenase (short-subunit alcohol dehydrogenase family)